MDSIPAFDETRYYLGPLCKNGHEWGASRQSLRRRKKYDCAECHREDSRQRGNRGIYAAKRTLVPGARYSQADVDRFWSRVDKHGPEIIPGSPCWIWKGWKSEGGYGMFYLKGKDILASHFSLELAAGAPLAEGEMALHRCDNPACMRDDHLWIGTQAENIADRDAKGHTARGDRHYSRKSPELVPRGERHWHTTLKNEQVRDILRRAAMGEKGSRLAREYGVSHCCVSEIIHRKVWRHITL